MEAVGEHWSLVLQFFDDKFKSHPIPSILTAVLVCLVVSKLVKYLWRNRASPPGPIGLPIVGYLPFLLGKDFHREFHRLGQKYGPFFSVKLGEIDTVVINGYEAQKESGRKDEFTSRPPDLFNFSDESTHIALMDGKIFKDQRRFIQETLRNVGMGNLEVEDSIKEQISITIDKMKSLSGKGDVNVRDLLSPAINSIIIALICGNKVPENQHVTTKVLSKFQYDLFDYFDRTRVPYFFPLLSRIYRRVVPSVKELRKTLLKFEHTLRKEVEEHQKTFDKDEKMDYIDYYLNEIKQKGEASRFSVNSLLGNGQVMLTAGSETIRSTLEWTSLCLARHQLIQEMVHKEIVSVLGSEKQPEWKDRENLILVQALILEVMRYKTLAPTADPHWTAADVKLGQYVIPKDTMVMYNLWSVHNDEAYWGDPENFRPERFLSNDLKSIVNWERVVPFGVGKRNCPGDKLAEVEVFLFVTSLLQKFRFLPPENGVSLEEMSMSTQMVAKPFVRLQLR